MNVRTITANGLTYRASFPDTPPMGRRPRVVMQARLVDELTGLALAGQVSVSTQVLGMTPRSAGQGVVGLIGRPDPRFPMLDAFSAPLRMQVGAERYLTQDLAVDQGPFNTGLGDPADFPDYFAAADLGDVPMHRAPVTFEGRTLQTAGLNRAPLSGVLVELTGVWTLPPTPDVDPDMTVEVANLLELRQGLYRHRIAGVDQLRERPLVIGAQTKTLLAPAGPGFSQLQVSDRLGLVVGELLAIADGAPDRAEYVQISAIDGAQSPAEAAVVTLAYPLRRGHFTGTAAAPAQLPPGPVIDNALLRDGIPGDTTIHLTSINPGIPDHAIVEIAGSGDPEYHIARRYRAVSDPEGDYRLPPLSRVSRIRLQASRADLPTPEIIDISPVYTRPGNRLEFLFPP